MTDDGRITMQRMVSVLVLVAAMAVPAFAQEATVPGERAMEAVAAFLQLEPEQLAAWQALLEQRAATAEPIREEMRAIGEQLRALLDGEAPDACAVGELVLAERALAGELREAHLAYLAAFEALLDSEQAGRLSFVRRADRVQPLLPAFRLFGLLAPPPDAPHAPGAADVGGLL